MRASLMALGTIIAAATACGESYGSGPSGSCSPSATQVCLKNTAFNPASLTVSAGAEVVWVNADGFSHTVTSSSVPATGPTWDHAVAAGARTSVRFTLAGTYQYYCKIHGGPGTGMHATVVVQ